MWYRLKDVRKRGVFENEEKKPENEGFVVKNFMFQERVSPLLMTSSAMAPIYKRTEFMVLSAGVVLYWIVMVFIGTTLIMCCICTKSRAKRNEVRKNKREDATEDA
ncbi:hypothetical protein LOAG_03938 [Loa loa]|uniref:Uncharacterized protein n=1 Tax=Loa loa TaxID=7209 RepID=A0A1S0U568_LOALO|nr:hypothetical protein LOAG_03938 [Loa loa]EFO24547.1 hypothetical protein LOAG_03938 [Loa loa]